MNLLAALIVVAALAGCGGDDSSGGGGGGSAGASNEKCASGAVVIKMANIKFDPANATAKVGQSVCWENEDTVDHDAVAQSGASFKSDLFSKGQTAGVFQFESSGMRDTLRKAKPQCLEDLIALNALYRPGPLRGGVVERPDEIGHHPRGQRRCRAVGRVDRQYRSASRFRRARIEAPDHHQ